MDALRRRSGKILDNIVPFCYTKFAMNLFGECEKSAF